MELVEQENNYNNLYPKPNEELAKMLNKYIQDHANLQLGRYVNVSSKQTFPLLIKKSVKHFIKRKCSGCTGSHQFLIAGGYAAYLNGLTTVFSDIDIYIDCTKLLDGESIYSTNFIMKTQGVVTTIKYTFNNSYPKIQFVQVTFDIGLPKDLTMGHNHRQLMAMYVMNKFDLPVCRVSVFLPLNKEVNIAYVIDASAFKIFKSPTSEARKTKYEERKVKNRVITAPSLQLSIVFNMFNKLD